MQNCIIKEIKNVHSQIEQCYDRYIFRFQIRDKCKCTPCVDSPKHTNNKLATVSFAILQRHDIIKIRR